MATKKTGITLAAEGEKEFRKALRDIGNEMSIMRSEMTIVTSEFVGNEKSVEALTAKGKVLNEMYDKQSEKIEMMRDALVKIRAGYGENSEKAQKWEKDLKKNEAALAKTKAEIIKNNTAMEEAKKAGDDMSDGLEKVEESAKKAGEATLDMSDIIKGNLISSAIQSGIGAIKDNFLDLAGSAQQASNMFQATTGIAADAMGEYNDAIESIYKNNFGDSLQDVAEKMAKVKEVTGEVDASALQNLTESAITLEDTFGMDMTETLRGVNALMDHFGMTANDAFDLIASGAQQGLNYTDELGDNVSEYSGKFAEAGYSAKEYFQLLKNGANGGAYNLDKVNDAINEVTTRIADGTISDSMDMWTSKTQKTFEAWTEGKATQKDVINEIVADITGATSEQEKMNLAAKAFGTMAEDGGTQFIESLSALGDSFDDVGGKMEDIKQIRYDDMKSDLEGLGRTVQLDIIVPLLETFMPDIKDGMTFLTDKVGWLIDHKDVLVAGISAIAAGFATWKIVSTITGVVNAVRAFQLANEGASTAQAILNAVMLGNPAVFIAAAIAFLVAGIAVFVTQNETAREAVGKAWDWIKEKVGGAVDWTEEKFEKIVEFFKDNWAGILLFIVNPFAGAFKLLYDNCEGFHNFVDEWLGKIKDGFDTGLEFIKELPGKALEWGKDLIDGFVDGIKGGINKVEDAAGKVAGKVKSFLHFSVPDEGPLADADEYGPDFVDLYASGIRDNISKIEDAASDMAIGLKTSMNPDIDSKKDTKSNNSDDRTLIANINIGGKKVATVMTPLVVRQMNRDNRNKEVVTGA
jgi:phage-related minor tail protein